MTGDPHEPRCDWLQQARIEISSNTIIFHDETFVKMVTVEDILNRLSEERQRCYRAHSDAETRQQEPVSGKAETRRLLKSLQEDICCDDVCKYSAPACDVECPHEIALIETHDAVIAQATRKELLDVLDLECEEIKSRIESSAMGQPLSEKSRGRIIGILDVRVKIKSLRAATLIKPENGREYRGDPKLYRLPRTGDKIETGVLIEGDSGPSWYGGIETVVYVDSEGIPKTRPKWAKVNKIPMVWRWPLEESEAGGDPK